LVNDAFKLTGKHSQKAYSIDDSAIVTNNGIHGMFLKLVEMWLQPINFFKRYRQTFFTWGFIF
jgi:hypothetical protein